MGFNFDFWIKGSDFGYNFFFKWSYIGFDYWLNILWFQETFDSSWNILKPIDRLNLWL